MMRPNVWAPSSKLQRVRRLTSTCGCFNVGGSPSGGFARGSHRLVTLIALEGGGFYGAVKRRHPCPGQVPRTEH